MEIDHTSRLLEASVGTVLYGLQLMFSRCRQFSLAVGVCGLVVDPILHWILQTPGQERAGRMYCSMSSSSDLGCRKHDAISPGLKFRPVASTPVTAKMQLGVELALGLSLEKAAPKEACVQPLRAHLKT